MRNLIFSFLDGMSSVFGLFPSKINNPYENSDDSAKLQQDWNVVSKDLEQSFYLEFSGKDHELRRKRVKTH